MNRVVPKNLLDCKMLSGKATYLASEKALSRYWLTKEEDEVWAYLQNN